MLRSCLVLAGALPLNHTSSCPGSRRRFDRLPSRPLPVEYGYGTGMSNSISNTSPNISSDGMLRTMRGGPRRPCSSQVRPSSLGNTSLLSSFVFPLSAMPRLSVYEPGLTLGVPRD